MSDVIAGMAILDTQASPQRLYVLCTRNGKHALQSDLPVYPKGTAKPCNPAWEYEVCGHILNVTPSVHIRAGAEGATMFHNDGAWSVKYKPREGKADDDGWKELRAANPEIPV